MAQGEQLKPGKKILEERTEGHDGPSRAERGPAMGETLSPGPEEGTKLNASGRIEAAAA